jgi:tetratricopeptide (TPR) repeat protein
LGGQQRLAQHAFIKAILLQPTVCRCDSIGKVSHVATRCMFPRTSVLYWYNLRKALRFVIREALIAAQNAGTWANLGAFYLRQGNKELAHQAFAQAQAHDPSLSRAWVGQALVAESIGDEVTDDLFRHTVELSFEVCILIIAQLYLIGSTLFLNLMLDVNNEM